MNINETEREKNSDTYQLTDQDETKTAQNKKQRQKNEAQISSDEQS